MAGGGGGEQNYSEGGGNTSLDCGEELTEQDWESIEQYRWGREGQEINFT